MKYKNKGIFIIAGIFFIVAFVIFLESKKNSMFSEKIIAEISNQLGEDLESFFMPLQKDLDEVKNGQAMRTFRLRMRLP